MVRNSLKNLFHGIRDYVRYIREYHSIQEVKKLLSQHQVFCFLGHLGEAYMAGAVLQSLEDSEEKALLILKEQEYVKDVFALFPDKKIFKVINNRTRNLLLKALQNEPDFRDGNVYTEFFQKNKSDNMIDSFKKLFNTPEGTSITPFVYENKEKQMAVMNQFKRLNGTLKKTVLIFPDAETVSLLHETPRFWLLLADKLKQAGFAVIFNSKNTFAEYQSVFLPIKETVCLAQACGYAIGKRNGMLDVLAGTTDIIIEAIYPVFTNENQHLYDVTAQYYNYSKGKSKEENYLVASSLKQIRADNKIIELIWKPDSEEFLNLLVANIVNAQNL